MNADEVMLIRDIRRMFDKIAIDSARMEVSVSKGHVTLRGSVTTLRSHPLVNLKEEVDELERRLRRNPRIKLLSLELRIVQPKLAEHEHFKDSHFKEIPDEHKDEEDKSE